MLDTGLKFYDVPVLIHIRDLGVKVTDFEVKVTDLEKQIC